MPLRTVIVALAVCAGVGLGLAPAAWAQGTVSVQASVSGGQIAFHVSGATDTCSYCTSEAVQVEADPTDGGPATSCWPSSPQVTYPISTGGGSFDFSSQIAVDGGQSYQVCGFVVQSDYGQPFPSAESQPALVTVPPSACAAGGEHALSLSAPRSVPSNLRGLIDVQPDSNSLQTVSSATLSMQTLSAATPFYSHTFTGSDLNQLSSGNGIEFYIALSRGDGPARVSLSYVQTASDFADQLCVDTQRVVVSPARAITPQIATGTSFVRKPGRIIYSGDGAAFVGGARGLASRLRWSVWGTNQARGSGDDWHDNCVPACATGRYSGYPVKVRLWRPRVLDAHLVFTRMTTSYTGQRPPYPAYQHAAVTYQLHYDAAYNAWFWR